MKEPLRRLLLRLGPDLIVLSLFTAVWMILIPIYGGKIHFVEGSTALPSLIVLALIGFAFFSHIREIVRRPGEERISFYRRSRRVIRDWAPLIALVAVYETLRDYTGVIRPDSIDAVLHRLDVAWFGVEPTLWIQRFIHPFWTDYFALMYMLYFFLPMVIGTLLYVGRHREDFRELALGCVLCMYGGYLLYLLFPAGPPRFHSELPFDPAQLRGLFGFYEFSQGKMDVSAHVMHKSSFPSLHCALSLLAVLHAWRFGNVWNRKWLVAFNGWIAVSIWVATIYLRHHWIVDIFAGWILGIGAYFGARGLRRVWERLESRRPVRLAVPEAAVFEEAPRKADLR